MWITNSDFKACQNSFMIRVMVCWPWGKTQSRVLKLFILQNRPRGMLFGKEKLRCKSSFCIPIKDGSIFLLSFIRHRLKSSCHHRSFSNAEPSQPWGAERAISCLIWSESPCSCDWAWCLKPTQCLWVIILVWQLVSHVERDFWHMEVVMGAELQGNNTEIYSLGTGHRLF